MTTTLLDGRTMTGFLAALGVQRALDAVSPGTRLGWSAAFRAELKKPGDQTWDENSLLRDLVEGLGFLGGTAEDRFPWKNLTMSRDEFRGYAERSVADASRILVSDDGTFSVRMAKARAWPDFVAALSSDGAPDGSKKGVPKDTALRTLSGTSNQHFLGTMDELSQKVTPDRLRDALFTAWTYPDKGLSLRWDPLDNRRHAYRARDPSNQTKDDFIRSQWGATRLAFEGIACLSTYPSQRALWTTGVGDGGREPVLVWPLWSPSVTADTVRALLGMREILIAAQVSPPSGPSIPGSGSPACARARRELAARGVFVIALARRRTEDRQRNFGVPTIWPLRDA